MFRHDETDLPEDIWQVIPYPDDYLREILSETRSIAVIGWSAHPARPSHSIAMFLKAQGRRVIPINPGHAGEEAVGQVVRARLSEVPAPVDMALVFRRSDAIPEVTEEILAVAAEKRLWAVWMQTGIRHDPSALRLEQAGLSVVMNRCSMVEMQRLGVS